MTVLNEVRERVGTASPSSTLRYVPLVALLTDIGLVAASVVLAVLGRKQLSLFTSAADISSHLTFVGPLLVLGWVVVVYLAGGYRADVFGAGTDEYKRVFNASIVTAGLLGVACYLAKFQLSRGFFLLAFAVGIPLLLLGRWASRQTLHRARRAGRLQQGVVIAGTAPHIDEIANVLRRESWLGYRIIGAITPVHDDREETPAGIPVLGDTTDVTALVMKTEADVIFFAGGSIGTGAAMRQAVWDLEQHRVQVVVAPSVTDISNQRIKVRPVGGLPLMHVDPPTWSHASRLGKRVFDVVGSLSLLVLLSPVFVAVAAVIRLHDGGPVLFKHNRVGRHGGSFECLKFRTMCTDAEDRIKALQVEHGQQALLFKLKDDPRITRPGRTLRRFSIDELPQLLNVLLGDMSLVGPRPQVPAEVELYDSAMSRRLHVRPGVTGLWQVSGRSDLSAEEAVRLDLYYVDNWSMLQDLSILAKTLRAVVSRQGAY
ncbi:sugar transferase [Nocardioides sp.]|uniref:sugar transferase n=1 Tax=Nocardioides sp. TaxID=35761 RepID=UPI001A341C79|nr:sugar transferase [Nocardioides sp.]MBJ7358869.1 sugar transferase [Nocardioides sp.]